MGQSIVDWLVVEGYEVRWFRSGTQAIQGLASTRPDIILCDIRLPDMTGEAIHEALNAGHGGAPTIFITGHGDVAQAVRLMRAGASDYITKPFDIEALLRRIEELLAPRWATSEGFTLGDAPAIRQVERMLRRVATIDSTVLLTGPSGSGKEVAARFLHAEGTAAAAPFVALNCAAIPTDLLESEIFGHERGALPFRAPPCSTRSSVSTSAHPAPSRASPIFRTDGTAIIRAAGLGMVETQDFQILLPPGEVARSLLPSRHACLNGRRKGAKTCPSGSSAKRRIASPQTS